MKAASSKGFTGLVLGICVFGGCHRPMDIPMGERISLRPVANGFAAPVALVEPNDGTGRVFVVDLPGIIYVVDGSGKRYEKPFLDLRDRVVALAPTYDERGLLSLAFHPDYMENRRFFVTYNAAAKGAESPPEFDADLVLSEFVSSGSPDVADPASERILLRIPKPQFNHNGGQLAFGPHDGMLYLSVGDGG